MKVITAILLYFVLTCPGNCQGKIADSCVIYWDKQRKLTWADFQGVPVKNDFTTYSTETMAASAVEISYNTSIFSELIDIKIYCRFIKSKSWTKDTTSQNLLAHEQLHFNIGELFARKIRMEICLLEKKGVKDYDVYKQKINELLKNRDMIEEKYDKETLHGVIDLSQQEWNEKIAKELEELKEYAVNYEEYLKNK